MSGLVSRLRAVMLATERPPPSRFVGASRALGAARDDAQLAVALARSLHALDPSGSRVALERLGSARPELRAHIDAILDGR